MPDANSVPDTLDAVLRKYGKIWIWSILSAAVAALATRSISGATLTATAVSFNTRPPFGFALLLLSLAAIVSSVCTLAAVYNLLLFLRHHIVPILFPLASHEEATEAAALPASSSNGGRLLWHAFAAVVLAVAAEVAIGVFSFIYRLAA